jgi:hypothetical protein
MFPIGPIAKRLTLILGTGVFVAIVFFVALESRSIVRYSVRFNAVASAIFGLVIIGLGTLSVVLNKAFPGSTVAAGVSRAVDPQEDLDD